MRTFFSRFAKNTGGATAIEYGLIAGLIAVVLAFALVALTPKHKTTSSAAPATAGSVK